MMDVFKKSRHRVSCLLLFACLITLSCTDFIARVDLQGDWTCLRSGKIVLYCRPSGFSGVPSPASDERDSLVSQQNFYYTVICDSIQKTFDDEVVIYLYNSDEAAEHIGTSGGGHAIPKLNAIYFTYLPGQREHTDPYGIENPLMGAHELAHVISHRTLGYPGTKLMSEGYANWMDGGYAGYGIAEIIRHYRDNEPEKIMTPDRLLYDTSVNESVYYPNCGVFTRYLVRRYGIGIVNRLFVCPDDDFKGLFISLTGDSWEVLCAEYADYLDEI